MSLCAFYCIKNKLVFYFLVALFSHQPCHFHVVGGTIIQFSESLLLVAMVLSTHFQPMEQLAS